jgi:hypothetical protein
VRPQQACLPVCQVQTWVQEYRELLNALCTIAIVRSFGPERLRCSGADLHHLCDTGNYHHVYDAGYQNDRHERAAWLSTGLRDTPTHHYGDSYPLVAVRTAQMAEHFSFLSSFLFNMEEAASRVDTLPQPANPYAPDTAEYERWWAEIAERSVSNDPPSLDD